MEYSRLKPIDIVRLGAPHTWPASVLPAALGGVLAILMWDGDLSIWPFAAWACCLIAAVLMQCAVNSLNDYHDFVSGTDTEENSDDPTDAVLVYRNISPKSVRNLGIDFLCAAGIFGMSGITIAAATYKIGYAWAITALIIGACGVAVILLYSFGPKPISYTPLGELFSGIIMGAGITIGVFTITYGDFSFMDFDVYNYVTDDPLAFDPMLIIVPAFMSIPIVIGIGLIMMTNNICDIERDKNTRRKTLPVYMGRKIARGFYRVLVILWYVSMLFILVSILFSSQNLFTLITVAVLLLLCVPFIVKLMRLKLTSDERATGMKTITLSNIIFGAVYIIGIVVEFYQLRGG